MKISIAISVLVLTAAAALGWRNEQQLTIFRVSYAKLVAEAARLGISMPLDDTADVSACHRTSSHRREDEDAAAKSVAARLIIFIKNFPATNLCSPENTAKIKLYIELRQLMFAMDADQLKLIFTEVRAAGGIDEDSRKKHLAKIAEMMGTTYPQAALEFFSEMPDFFKDKHDLTLKMCLAAIVASSARDNPSAALEWLKKNATKFPDFTIGAIHQGLVSGSALSDPKFAFEVMGEFQSGKIRNSSDIDMIASAAKTPEERTSYLKALRGFLTTLPNEETRNEVSASGLSSLTTGLTQSGFEVASKWLATARLTPDETVRLVAALDDCPNNQRGQWIEWIGKALPVDQSVRPISSMINRWAENDYQAAGKWLAATPAGPGKDIAIGSYAETVAPYQPETAAQWALTLPPGPNRDQTLASIYKKWPVSDPAAKSAAEEFRNAHGIE